MDDLNSAFGRDYGQDWAEHPLELDAGTYEVWVERGSIDFLDFPFDMRLRRL